MNRRVGVAAIGIVLCIIAVLLLYRHESMCLIPPTIDSRTPLSEERLMSQERISACGGKQAYALLSEALAGHTTSFAHREAHVMGSALYAVEPQQALGICDSKFSYGCYHQVVGEFIAEHGLQSLDTLSAGGCNDEQASTSPLISNCAHGMGHGIVGFLGYDPSALSRALTVCDGLTEQSFRLGCYGGAFMEYNLRLLATDDATSTYARASDPRALGSNVLSPCDSLAAKYAPTCYFWQVQLWNAQLSNGEFAGKVFSRIGARCGSLPAEINRQACFEGAGKEAAWSTGFDPGKGRVLCTVVSSQRKYQTYCAGYMGMSIRFMQDNVRTALDACDALSEPWRASCQDFATTAVNGPGPGPFALPPAE